MNVGVVGQRCVSEREPELGLGRVASVEVAEKRIAVEFPASGEKRLYALGTAVLKRVQFRAGETLNVRDGTTVIIDAVQEADGLLTYVAAGRRIPEEQVSDVTSLASPYERLVAAQTDPSEVFDLRYRARAELARLRSSEVRGYLGGRVELIPHQFFILHEVSSRMIPRVLLADEVGLGKTIEACLILQRLLAVGQVRRALILVPETLVHQWFVELLRRFNLWFTLYDEERCRALQESDPAANPFLAAQLALCSVRFLSDSANRQAEAVAAGWDIVIVDEAHHLGWAPDAPSAEYSLVEQLARRTPGLLLLTATPTQLGQEGHFARLRLLDPERYRDYPSFVAESERYAAVAAIAGKIVEGRALQPRDHSSLTKLFNRDPERLAEHLTALAAGKAGAREALLRSLLDEHGIGRVMFRNTRAAMHGFPVRRYCPVLLPSDGNPALIGRVAREFHAEETGTDATLRYAFRDDPKVDWLARFLREHKEAKVLLICRTQRKAVALETALQEKMKAKSALFHEGLPLVQRDRNAAWFAESDGAQLLICSEIGSEGRNFQFAHHLVLFDLPLNPGLVEQRIGRLDRIGQTETIRIHVPQVAGSAEEWVAAWYARGLAAFERPLHGGTEFQDRFRARLLGMLEARRPPAADEVDALIDDTVQYRKELDARMRKGRDRLLELNSFNPVVAGRLIDAVRAAEADPALRNLLFALLDHFGVRVREHEGGEVFFDPSHAYVEAFPSLPADGMLGTFERRRALAREDITFLSADHPLIEDAIGLLLDSPVGTTAFGYAPAKAPNLLLEAVFVLEPVADSRWHVDQFLSSTPIRVVVDLRGRDLTDDRDPESLAGYVADGDLHRFLEQPGFTPDVLRRMLEQATREAEPRAAAHRKNAADRATQRLGENVRRLVDLARINDHVPAGEIALARERLEQTVRAIASARVRLDALRVVVEGAAGADR